MMNPKQALQIIAIISWVGIIFSGTLTFQEFFGKSTLSCPAPGAPGTVFGYPACVYGLLMYIALAVIAYLGLRNIHTPL